jgi:hypothetical protein
MLFHITQTHTPETCPKEGGGSKALFNPNVEGLTLRTAYGAFSEHVIFYIVQTDSMEALNKFLEPGMTRCTSEITPVSEEPLVR